jgi:hypothetical protein
LSERSSSFPNDSSWPVEISKASKPISRSDMKSKLINSSGCNKKWSQPRVSAIVRFQNISRSLRKKEKCLTRESVRSRAKPARQRDGRQSCYSATRESAPNGTSK